MGSVYERYGAKISWVYEGDPTSKTNVTQGASNPGRTVRDRTGKVTVYINSFAFSDPNKLFLVIGHEYIHADHFLSGQFDKWALKYDRVTAEVISYFYAYAWQATTAHVFGVNDLGGLQQTINHTPFMPWDEVVKFSKR